MCRSRRSIICISQDCRSRKSPLYFCSIPTSLCFFSQFCCLAGRLVLFHESQMRTASKRPGCTINRIELHQTHTELKHARICRMHIHTVLEISPYTHTHVSHWKARIFLLALFNLTSYPCQLKDSLSEIPPFILFIRLLSSFSWSHLFHLYTALLFPRQPWQRTLHRMIQPMAVAVVWVVVLLGSVELAASVCMLWVYACTWGEL